MAPEAYPMNGGDDTYSYTKNSNYQRDATNFVSEIMKAAIAEKLDVKSLTSTSNTLRIADLGCSVGPNTFVAMQNVLETMEKNYHSQGLGSKMPEFHVFFNDHASNDFNTLFSSLPPDRQYFATGVPGSFHGRLFPESSLHFVHSSYALQWLTKVPEELLDENSRAWNKARIHYACAKEEVANAYAAQFEKDMEIFLNARAKETVVGGMMVLILPGHQDDIHHSQGLVGEAEVDSFNLPVYFPSPNEMAPLVERNACFSIERMEMMRPRSNTDIAIDAQTLIMHLRAGMEGVFTKHFGREIVDEMFERAFQKSPAEFSRLLDLSSTLNSLLFLALKRK
ncbi:loganic acid O-methyltransferase-like isoform X2 [Cornus florida]|uniref:loganic acid O-methyltransferase-like isoform X2 n=1 Tax=Cornus florida TaxID=4283 RepID=UPI00289DE63A|nr:loganic acid O-methyltransferase-like isoform X2 [Cornus florida]